MRDMITGGFGDSRMSKTTELNPDMTIVSTGYDELTKKLNGGLN